MWINTPLYSLNIVPKLVGESFDHTLVTHQAEQTADLINGPQAAEEAHEHGESSNANQDVAGDLNRQGIICVRENHTVH